jgi:uncharacterized protein (DUF488 family)
MVSIGVSKSLSLTMTNPIIYTIGHSTHPIDYFLELLQRYHVNCVVDVRSMPASRFNPQFNKKSLASSLKSKGIGYLHFGDSFGARQTDPLLMDDDGRVDFEKVRNTNKFKDALSRIRKGAHDGYSIALMCSEAEPLSCHRFVMISPALKDFKVHHILKDQSILNQEDLEEQLLKKFSKELSQTKVFESNNDKSQKLTAAYKMMNKIMGYMPDDDKKSHTT